MGALCSPPFFLRCDAGACAQQVCLAERVEFLKLPVPGDRTAPCGGRAKDDLPHLPAGLLRPRPGRHRGPGRLRPCVLVPREHESAAHDAISAELAGVTIGNPTAEGVRMGAVVSLAQRGDVRRAVRRIAESGRFVYGDPDRVRVIDADAERGAFLDTLLISADPEAAAPHEVEPFGPAATVLAYRDTAHATDLIARGRGSLVASVVGDDLAWTTAFVRGTAPWHGRLHLLDSTNMARTTGHGSPLPALRHGGPGRAGGGSEMAGTRGVVDLMQRTALQASPRLLDSLYGEQPAAGCDTV
ncbi:aldehyde dehydrogenase family protein [Streptomyces sp. Go-475]|uniref:aldehyde dehydrogenase family protein n=1 Tax=Streptomyces sp. Go-475 TaxID=2072505 RepID=UPI001E5D5E20|nr:aldehyde dehydrogenase family protein [Streptomyces sp. Go-475]